MDALLIIDMQVGCFSKVPRFDTEGTVKRINRLSAAFRDRGKPVVFIQHDGTKEDYLFPGTEDFQVLPELLRAKDDIFITKAANDAFYRSELDGTLKSMDVDTLYVTGLATEFCVNATIHSALVRDYNQVIVQDCHTTADRPVMNAREIIDFHNWLWANLTPTVGTIAVKSMEEILKSL
jgi:nicotinamidase-related amidase